MKGFMASLHRWGEQGRWERERALGGRGRGRGTGLGLMAAGVC